MIKKLCGICRKSTSKGRLIRIAERRFLHRTFFCRTCAVIIDRTMT